MSHHFDKVVLWTIVRKEVRQFLSVWYETLLPPVLSAVLYLVIFGGVVGDRVGSMQGLSYLDFVIPGLVLMSVIMTAFQNVAFSLYYSKFDSHIEEMLVSPISNQTLLTGFVIGGTIRGSLVAVLVIAACMFISPPRFSHPEVIIITLLLSCSLFAITGFINGLYAKHWDDISYVPTFVLVPLTFLGGVFYAIELLPSPWQELSLFNPVTYMVSLFRYGFTGVGQINMVSAVLVLFGCNLLFWLYASFLLKKGTGLRS